MRADDASFEIGDKAGASADDDACYSVRGDAVRLPVVEKPSLIALHNLPEIPGICEAELDAIERYMSDILDEVFSGIK